MLQHYRKNNRNQRSNQPVKRINMEDKTSTGLMRYQGRGINVVRVFVRGSGKFYGTGPGCGFNPTKPKVQGKHEALGRNVYSIGYAQQQLIR